MVGATLRREYVVVLVLVLHLLRAVAGSVGGAMLCDDLGHAYHSITYHCTGCHISLGIQVVAKIMATLAMCPTGTNLTDCLCLLACSVNT